MKKHNPFNKPRAIAIPVQVRKALTQKLVLKRVKPPPKHRGWLMWRFCWRGLKLLPNLLRKTELVRQMAPGVSLPEHKWRTHERATQSRIKMER